MLHCIKQLSLETTSLLEIIMRERCPSGRLCTFLIRLYAGYQGVLCDKPTETTAKRPKTRTLVSKTKQVQSGINLDKSAHKHRKGQKRRLQHANAAHFVTEGNERRRVGPNTKQISCERVYVIQILCLNPYKRSKPGSGGIGVVAVRSNKGFAVSLLFRHSIMTVIEKGWVFPPHLTQL
jgi:hypothetical protein